MLEEVEFPISKLILPIGISRVIITINLSSSTSPAEAEEASSILPTTIISFRFLKFESSQLLATKQKI